MSRRVSVALLSVAAVLASPRAWAYTTSDIANLATANLGQGACTTNSLGGTAFESSCTGNGGQPEYWCADFAQWVWANTGVQNTGQLDAAAGSFYCYGQNNGTLHNTPSVGDAVVFDYQGGCVADHVAIVTQVNGDGTIESVSGDWNGQSGSEATFSSTSSVVLNAPAYDGTVGGTPGVIGMTISGYISPVGVSAQPPDQAPQGWLDSADCTQIKGWTYDPDTPGTAINADVYFDGPAGSGATGVRLTAGVARSDLCSAIGSCDHGYAMPTPVGLMDGMAHTVTVYGIDSSGNGDNPQLSGAPKSFTCPAPPLPFAPAIKRHVTDPTVFSAWKFSYLTGVAHEADTVLNPLPSGADILAAPKLVQADDGTPEVWLLDGKTRRHVKDPASMTAWQFDFASIVKTPAAQVYAYAKGPDWPETPFLAQGSTAAVYFIDVAPPQPGQPDGGTAGEGGSGAGMGDGGSGTMPPVGVDGGAGGDDAGGSWGDTSSSDLGGASGCGCRVTSEAPGASGWALVVMAAAAVGGMRLRRRRRF